jgi:hypothetical protein
MNGDVIATNANPNPNQLLADMRGMLASTSAGEIHGEDGGKSNQAAQPTTTTTPNSTANVHSSQRSQDSANHFASIAAKSGGVPLPLSSSGKTVSSLASLSSVGTSVESEIEMGLPVPMLTEARFVHASATYRGA